MDDEATQCTQGVLDPRRVGRNNSGLSDSDISDVLCILHPCSPAAFKIVASTAERSPQHVLQASGFEEYDDGVSQSLLEEQETFILSSDGPNQAMDLALRFSTRTIDPAMGFIFGRNPSMCDIVLDTDTVKRVSNMHFRIFVNESGVVMLQDTSTNGTLVDDVVLRGKTANVPQTRMLNAGSIIQILSPKTEEHVKFILRIPSRDGHEEEFTQKFQAYMQQVAMAETRAERQGKVAVRRFPMAPPTNAAATGSVHAPLLPDRWGMHWGGGDKYNVVGHLGKGAFATVYQLATKSDGKLYAAKELEKRRFMKNGVLDRKLDNEMQIMRSISHPSIVQYVDYQDVANHLYIIMEFVPCGDLQQYLSANGALSENLAKCMAAQVFDAMAYLHKKKITHRDIKPDNVLIANNDPAHFNVKLSDFGLSKVVKDNDTFLKTFCGTLLYCAPEVFPHYDAHVAGKGKKRLRRGSAPQPSKFHSYSQSVDIWSFGAVLWFSLCIKPPFEGVADNTGRGMFDKIMMTPLDPTDLVKQGVSDDAVALLAEMLNTDPSSRPSPAYCLRHRWFGNQLPAVEAAAEPGLLAIAEEDEAEAGAEPDLSQLSLDEEGGSSNGSENSEVSIHSGDIEFFDPRQSKRVRSEAFAWRDQSNMIDSSPEALFQNIPIAHDPGYITQSQPPRATRKLFGEISQSALETSGVLGREADFVVSANDAQNATSYDSSARREEQDELPAAAQSQHMQQAREHQDEGVEAQQQRAEGVLASPSLLGAESLVRDLNMDSPHSSVHSPAAEPNEPTTPRTPDDVPNPSIGRGGRLSNATPSRPDDTTPKQQKFNRQIELPIPPSFYFDPDDLNTHNLEYASKRSGIDYLAASELTNSYPSLPATTAGSAANVENKEPEDDVPSPEAIPSLLPPPSEFVKPPPRLGRLVATPDSFTSITLNLSTFVSTWGRAPSNTFVYGDGHDTRIPKRGIIIYFHAKGIEKLEDQGADWTKLPDLHCLLTTDSSVPLFVNDVMLKKEHNGRRAFGKVYTGDEITIFPRRDGKAGLKFTCEFFHGEGKERRPEKAPKFEIRTETLLTGSGKGKEKEHVALPTSAMAA